MGCGNIRYSEEKMMKEKGETTQKVLRDLGEIDSEYRRTECYEVIGGKKVRLDCGEVVKAFLERADREFVIKNLRRGIEYRVKAGDVDFLEVEGSKVYMLHDEGDVVEEESKIAYTLSNRGVIRVVRSPFKARIVLIEEILGQKHDKLRIYLAREG